MASVRYPVYLRVYDISKGKAAVWSPVFLWKKIEGVWHTGVQVYGYEYFFGGKIQKMYPADFEESFDLKPKDIISLGYTNYSKMEFEKFLKEIQDEFARETYDLVKWNCNNFSDVAVKFLLGRGIPDKILGLPEAVNKTVMGSIILRGIKAMNSQNPISLDDNDIEQRSERVANTTRIRRFNTLHFDGTGEAPVLMPACRDVRRSSCPCLDPDAGAPAVQSMRGHRGQTAYFPS